MRIRGRSRELPWSSVQVRVPARDLARVEAFVRAWRALHPGGRSAALRALLGLGLDAAARPATYDERWLDVQERLSRVESLLDALGVAVSAIPALVAFLQSQADARLDDEARAALADAIELLIQADWDQRCRARGIPRPRFVKLPRCAPIGRPVREPARRPWKTSVRLTRETRARIAAVALRDDVSSQAALRHALDLGLRALEAAAHHDALERLWNATKRIEIQLDEIGALATGAPAVAVHLWRRSKRLPDEHEALLLAELHDVALATWAHILAGPAQPPLPDVDDAAPARERQSTPDGARSERS